MKKIYISVERPKPEEHDTLFLESLARYYFIKELVKNKAVLDIGCGFGGGVNLLSDYAEKVIGIDNNKEVIEEAKKIYKKRNIDFIPMDGINLRFLDGTFDVVCSFEVIEHIKDYGKFLDEVFRVLKPGGLFVLSTPNNKEAGKPGTPFHVKEFNRIELDNVLKEKFCKVKIYGMTKPSEVYVLEDELRRLRKLDIIGLKKIIPRKLISKMVYFIAKIKKIPPPQKMRFEDFKISSEDVENSAVLLAICEKIFY